jgi:hypothetical protein
LLGTIFWGYTGIANLVGFFSGWIAAVIGFYFLQQNTSDAQAQAKTATESAATQTERANTENQKKVNLANAAKTNLDDLEATVSQLAENLKALKEKTAKQVVPADMQKFQVQLENLLKETKAKGKQPTPEFHAQVADLVKESRGTGASLASEDVAELHTKVDVLSREAQEKLKKAKETIALYSA